MAEKTHIRTSGWHYAQWRGPFYLRNISDDEMLNHCAKSFRAIEINNSFHHLPSQQIFKLWKPIVRSEAHM